MLRSPLTWIVLAILLAGGGFISFLVFGYTTVPTVDTQAAMLKTANTQMVKGNPKAPVKIVEYADFLCPYCAKFTHDVMPSIEQNYIDTGKVAVEFRPVNVIAEDSGRAAEGAYCAADQKKFWDYYTTAYNLTWNNYYAEGKKPADVPLFKAVVINDVARQAGLNVDSFSTCIQSGKYTTAVATMTKQMADNGFNGTPSFLINQQHYTGYAPYNVVKLTIDSYIK